MFVVLVLRTREQIDKWPFDSSSCHLFNEAKNIPFLATRFIRTVRSAKASNLLTNRFKSSSHWF